MIPKSRYRRNGVVRIVRDTYSSKLGSSNVAKTQWATVRQRVLERDGFACVKCHTPRSELPYLEVHHIKPLSKGGKTVMSNLVCLCESCHAGKHKHLR